MKTIYPQSTIGIIGDSPNGIMLARTAKQMGYQVLAYSSNENTPTLNEADMRFIGGNFDKLKLQDFAQRCDVLTYESTQVSAEVIKFLQQYTNVVQGYEALELFQDRLVERAFFEELNLNIAPYATVVGLDDIYQAVSSIGYPCILKPIQKGYSAKEFFIQKQTDIAKCAGALELGTYILESYLPRAKEISLIAIKSASGAIECFDLVECIYQKQSLKMVLTPLVLPADIQTEIMRQAYAIMEDLNYVGALQIGFYLTQNQTIYIKDVVACLHEIGYVFDKAANVTMFEQHLRAITNTALVKPKIIQPTVQINLDKVDQMALNTQLTLKDNWFYNYYRYPETMQAKYGYVLVLADNVDKAKQQVEATGIWH